MANATIKEHESRGTVWKPGELVAGYEPRRPGRPSWERGGKPEYSITLCLEGRVLGPRGGVVQPGRLAAITGSSWAAVCRAVQSLGFTKPPLTAAEVRKGRS